MKRFSLFLALWMILQAVYAQKSPIDYVNPFIGTTNFGTTNPGALCPQGLMSVTPFNVMGGEAENKYEKDSRWWSTPYEYNNKFLTGFAHVNLSIRRGEKVAFVGRNGEGKSTLVKCILGEIPFEGSLKVGHNAQIGYFAQNQAQLLNPELTVFDTIDRVARGDIRTRIRDILGAFMFGGEESDKKVKVLSGGERSRLAMIKLLLEPVNFLILDEPTNHLDMRSKDVLKEAIRQFEGTVIVVSHDRDFLDGLVQKVYEFGGGKVKEHLGGIYDFLRDKHEQLMRQGADVNVNERGIDALFANKAQKKELADEAPKQPKAGALSYAEQKEFNKKLKKAERMVENCEVTISETESAISILEAKMATPEGASDMSLYERHQKLKQALDKAMDEWELASEELERLKQQQ